MWSHRDFWLTKLSCTHCDIISVNSSQRVENWTHVDSRVKQCVFFMQIEMKSQCMYCIFSSCAHAVLLAHDLQSYLWINYVIVLWWKSANYRNYTISDKDNENLAVDMATKTVKCPRLHCLEMKCFNLENSFVCSLSFYIIYVMFCSLFSGSLAPLQAWIIKIK